MNTIFFKEPQRRKGRKGREEGEERESSQLMRGLLYGDRASDKKPCSACPANNTGLNANQNRDPEIETD